MGLAEKRLAQEIQNDQLPAFESQIKEIAGYDVKVDIDWNTFTAYDSYPLSRLDIVFSDLTGCLKKICVDDMGKEALKEKMSTIKLTNVENADDIAMEFNGDVFDLKVKLVGDSFSAYSDSQLASYVESQL